MLQLRNIMQHHPRLALVLAGSHHLDEMRRDYWNPLLNIARVVKVGYLSPEAAYELITNPWDDFPLDYDGEAIDRITAVTGGQPLLLQAICSGVVERVNLRLARGGPQTLPTATLEDAEAEIQKTVETSEYFRAAFGALPAEGQRLLTALAATQTGPGAWVNRAAVQAAVAGQNDRERRPDDIAAGWDALIRRDMIDVDGDRVRVTVELVRRWLRRNGQ